MVDEALCHDRHRLIVLRFGHSDDPICVAQDAALQQVLGMAVADFLTVFTIDLIDVPELVKQVKPALSFFVRFTSCLAVGII